MDFAINIIETKLLDIHAENLGDVIIMGDMNVDLLTQKLQTTQRVSRHLLKAAGSLNKSQIQQESISKNRASWIMPLQIGKITTIKVAPLT